MAKNVSADFVLRPFEGIPHEADLVALREVVPAATIAARTTKEHGAKDVLLTTVLPAGWPALHRADGVVLVALQAFAGAGDASRELAGVLLEAIALEPGTAVTSTHPAAADAPRLQDVLDLTGDFPVTMHESFEYWLAADVEVTTELRGALDEANETLIPTERLESVPSAYWAHMGSRSYLRWAMPIDDDALLDAVARLHARRASAIGGAKFLGAFRSSGIVVPVWETTPGTELADLEKAVAAYAPSFDEALASDAPLSSDERRARAGLVARQVTLR